MSKRTSRLSWEMEGIKVLALGGGKNFFPSLISSASARISRLER